MILLSDLISLFVIKLIMIKPINENPLNLTNQFYYECESCGAKGTITIENRLVDPTNKFQMEELQEEVCPNCDKPLSCKKDEDSDTSTKSS